MISFPYFSYYTDTTALNESLSKLWLTTLPAERLPTNLTQGWVPLDGTSAVYALPVGNPYVLITTLTADPHKFQAFLFPNHRINALTSSISILYSTASLED